MKYRKKPVEIEAIQFNGTLDDVPDWIKEYDYDDQHIYMVTGGPGPLDPFSASVYAIIPTLEGNMKCQEGDYIIKGIKGELYPCKPDIFESTYEVIE